MPQKFRTRPRPRGTYKLTMPGMTRALIAVHKQVAASKRVRPQSNGQHCLSSSLVMNGPKPSLILTRPFIKLAHTRSFNTSIGQVSFPLGGGGGVLGIVGGGVVGTVGGGRVMGTVGDGVLGTVGGGVLGTIGGGGVLRTVGGGVLGTVGGGVLGIIGGGGVLGTVGDGLVGGGEVVCWGQWALGCLVVVCRELLEVVCWVQSAVGCLGWWVVEC